MCHMLCGLLSRTKRIGGSRRGTYARGFAIVSPFIMKGWFMKNRFVSGPRRGFAFITILLIIPVVVQPADRNSRPLFDISPRQDSNFSSGWVFIPREEPGVEKADFQDAAFERVSVPHANIMV